MKRDLTSGSVFKNVVAFSLPYLLSYFLQTLYGMADLFIIGQYEGIAATTAVSVGSQVMHMLTVMLVGLANIVDLHVVGTGSALRGAVICFYLSNEGLSLLENAAHIGLPVPDKLKDVLAQLHRREEKSGETGKIE